MEDLSADWKALRVMGRPRAKPAPSDTPDLHEDWIAVKGAKHPPYAFIVEWDHPEKCVVWRMAIVGKSRKSCGVFYRVHCVGILFKSPGTTVIKMDRPSAGPYERSQLCFTREEVERSIQAHRAYLLYRGSAELRRLACMIEETHRQMNHMAEYMASASQEPVPCGVMRKIPSQPSKKLVIP